MGEYRLNEKYQEIFKNKLKEIGLGDCKNIWEIVLADRLEEYTFLLQKLEEEQRIELIEQKFVCIYEIRNNLKKAGKLPMPEGLELETLKFYSLLEGVDICTITKAFNYGIIAGKQMENKRKNAPNSGKNLRR